ncbi:sensor histidine kinase [Parasedimentitalea marina]|nr:cache domain-containing protein [Parasedimentitalea marina]
MPLLLVLAMTRWNADYDDMLIANVDSDLRIAEQYLGRILTSTGTDIRSIAESSLFGDVLRAPSRERQRFLNQRRIALQLDFLYFLPRDVLPTAPSKWPVITAAAAGTLSSQIDIFTAQDLAALSPELQQRARIPLIETEAAVPTTRTVEDRGMVVHSAAPVTVLGQEGVLVGGILLNRNLDFIDTINALVYLSDSAGKSRQGTATLFLDDTRISTNVRLFEEVRALGTRVSASVRDRVLTQGQTWLDRAFVVNDWYISGYLPLTDSFGKRVGMLYVGFLEAPYQAAKRAAYWTIVAVFIGVIAISAPLFLWLAKGIFSPLEQMTRTMKRVERGDLAARNGAVGSRDEIGQVAAHLDTLLNQVQDRDQALRDWADELNTRVDKRTAELRTANSKLEDTFRQLAMSEKLASIGEITAGVAHEINNPVAVIQGNVDVIRMTLAGHTGEIETELNLIDNQVLRIDAIVGKLLQFARPTEFGTFEENVDIAPLVEDCLVLVDHVLSKQSITIHRAFEHSPPVAINPGELQQVVINLVMNAAQAMDGAGDLSLRLAPMTRDDQPGTLLSVCDTGPGITDQDITAVFNPFFTTKPGEGTGLGLSISQTLIQRAGGLISVRNRAQTGAEFSIWLPATEGDHLASNSTLPHRRPKPAIQTSSG